MSEITKIIISAEELRQDSWKLAARIFAKEEPFDLVIGLARGGVPIALYLQEFFLMAWPDHPAAYASLRCRSYRGIASAGEVAIGNKSEAWRELGDGSRILIVDDIFDRGTTIDAVLKALLRDAPRPLTIKTATLHYKPENSQVSIQPDYYEKVFNGGDWIVYPQSLSDFQDEWDGIAKMGLPADIADTVRREIAERAKDAEE